MDALDFVVACRSYHYSLLFAGRIWYLQYSFATLESLFKIGEGSMAITEDKWEETINQISWKRAITHTVFLREMEASAILHHLVSGALWSHHETGTHCSRAGTTGRSRWCYFAKAQLCFCSFCSTQFLQKSILITLLQICRHHTFLPLIYLYYVIFWHSEKQIISIFLT